MYGKKPGAPQRDPEKSGFRAYVRGREIFIYIVNSCALVTIYKCRLKRARVAKCRKCRLKLATGLTGLGEVGLKTTCRLNYGIWLTNTSENVGLKASASEFKRTFSVCRLR